MGDKSKIQWTDATWNIAVGCTKVDEDCKFCYMYRDGERFGYDAKTVKRTKTVFNMPLKLKEPSKIFTSSLTDVFHEDCDSFRNEMWDIIRKCPQHTFQILTKRPERINGHLPPDWGKGWDNVWLGTSAGSQKGALRINDLLQVPAITRFASIEPLYEAVNLQKIIEYSQEMTYTTNALSGKLSEWDPNGKGGIYDHGYEIGNKLDWVIVGGESGNDSGKYKYRPCHSNWIESIIIQCMQHNTPVFVKQLGTHLSKTMGLIDRHGGDIEEWPENLRVREFPKKQSVNNFSKQ